MARVLVIDNYDSFVFNLVQYLGELGAEPIVKRNDEITIDQIAKFNVDGILLSPGPGTPNDAGICNDIIKAVTIGEELPNTLPIFGVCLGHQCIGDVFGGSIIRAPTMMHGKTSQVTHNGTGVLKKIASPFTVTRYHSLMIDPNHVPADLLVTGKAEDGVIMSIRHRKLPIEGVQFHPESILTEHGHEIVANWLAMLPVRTDATK